MSDFNPDNELSPDELKVVEQWRKGCSMTDAYKKVMVPKTADIKPAALKKRVIRFFQSKRVRAAMEATQGHRGEVAKSRHERSLEAQRQSAIEQFKEETRGNEYLEKIVKSQEPGALESQYEELKTARDKWRESLQISDTPSIMSVTGTALFIMNTAVMEIIERKNAMKRGEVSALKNTALPTNLVAAFKAAADVILPFAPPPTTAERREMSKAGQILCSLVKNIQEKPEDYAASSKVIDVTNDTKPEPDNAG